MSFHTLILVGRLGQDPEMRYMPNGQAVANFSVATDRTYKNANEEQIKITTWFRVAVWGKMAEVCNQFLAKGSMVLIEGTLNPDKETGRPRVWISAEGNPGASYEVNAQTVRFLSSSGKHDQLLTLPESSNDLLPEDSIPF